MAMMDQFLLFGDSITQGSFNQDRGFAFGAALADIYARKLDIVNRGLSGYNSTQGLQALPLVMPEPEQARVRFMTICFGANDARIAGSPGGPSQTVPLEEFVRNLRGMVTHLAVLAHPGCQIILVTTPPIDERNCLKDDQERYPGMERVLRRTAVNTARYAQAVRDLGWELGLPVLDIHAAMLARAGYSRSTVGTPPASSTKSSPTTSNTSASSHYPLNPMEDMMPLPGSLEAPMNATLQSFLRDGLHFSGDGYRVLYGELMSVLEKHFPEQMPTRLPYVLPAWDGERDWMRLASAAESGGGGGDVAAAL